MTWNHRVVRREYPEAASEEDRVLYGIHEVYYDEAGVCDATTVEPEPVIGTSVDDLRWTLEHMLRALDKPVLDYETRKEITPLEG